MDKDMFERLLRTALQVIGAVVATKYVGEANWAALSGAILTGGTTIWTIYASRKAVK
jgi:uncharacterized transporter YbjL